MEIHESLIASLGRIGDLTDSDKDELRRIFVPQSIKKGEYLTEYGKVNDYLAFVAKGYFRVYVIDYDGNEVSVHLAGNKDFVGAITSFLTRTTSEEYVQAITDTEILTVSYKDLQELYDSSQTWDRIGRRIYEGLFIRKQQRVINFIKYRAEERYNLLMAQYPDMILNVPMIHIASYLGIKPETLSRIRAHIS